MADTDIDQTLTPEGAAELLGCSVYTVKEYARTGQIPHFKTTNRYRFRKSTLLAWIKEQELKSIAKGKSSS